MTRNGLLTGSVELHPGIEWVPEVETLYICPSVILRTVATGGDVFDKTTAVLWAFRCFMKTSYGHGCRFVQIVP